MRREPITFRGFAKNDFKSVDLYFDIFIEKAGRILLRLSKCFQFFIDIELFFSFFSHKLNQPLLDIVLL